MLKRIFNNPLTALIVAIVMFTALWVASLFPSDYKVGLFLQFTGTATFLVALMLCLIWLVWRIRTIYANVNGMADNISPDSKAHMASSTYLSVSIVMLAAAILCVG